MFFCWMLYSGLNFKFLVWHKLGIKPVEKTKVNSDLLWRFVVSTDSNTINRETRN